jgi:hypothetical protein
MGVGMRFILWLARIVLVLLLCWDAMLITKLMVLLISGGPAAVVGWVVHLGLEGRPIFESTREQRRLWERQAYFDFALYVLLVLFILPPLLYFLQRWLRRRLSIRGLARRAPRDAES